MRRNFKKALSAVLIAAMTLSTPIAVSENVTVAEAAEKTVLSDPSFFYDFEGRNPYANKGTVVNVANAEVVGGGSLKKDSGNQYFDNASDKEFAGGGNKGSNYLSLPKEIIQTIHKSKAHATTISMNIKAVDGKYGIYSPILGMDSTTNPYSYPCLAFEIRGTAVWNSAGWYNGDNSNNGPYETAYADGKWHNLTITLTETSILAYLDGVLTTTTNNFSAINGENGTYGIFDNGDDFILGIDRVALGGNQPIWADPDAQICYDDVAIFDKALTADEVKAFAEGNYVFYNRTLPYSISVTGKTELKDEELADGTIYWSAIKDEYHYGDVVSIEVDANKGKAVNMTVVNKTTSEAVDASVVSLENGKLAVQFEMPASDVEISSYGFTQINTTDLKNAVNDAKAIFDAGNDSKVEGIATVFTTDTWDAFSTAYKTAKEVYDNVDERNQIEVINSTNDLTKAQKALIYNCILEMKTADFAISGGATETLAVDITSNSKDPLKKTFTSSDEAVATVDEKGVVTGVSMGKATITVTTEDGKSDSVVVKVYGDTSLIVGQTANYNFAPVTDGATWTSSDEAVVTVSNGKAKAVATGSADITVTTKDDKSCTFKVNVIDALDCTVDFPMTSGVEVTDDGVYMTFKNTQNATATDNWNNPRLFIYSGNSPVMDKDPALRADLWVDNMAEGATNIGYEPDWASWLEECKAGADSYVSAIKTDAGIRVRMYVGSIWGEYIVPVEDGKDYYVALTGGLCNITDLKVVSSREFTEPTKPITVIPPKPSTEPTEAPSVEPTEAPSVEPSTEPTEAPATEAPSTEPTKAPSTEATKAPSKGDKINVSDNKFEVSSKSEVSYVAATKKDAAVVIPATVKVNGKVMKVTSISANAFKGNKAVKNITVSKNITKVGNNAFNGCKKLKTIVIKSTKLKASNISKKAFKGITKKTVIKVPKKKVKAYKKLFRSKGLSKNVKIKAI